MTLALTVIAFFVLGFVFGYLLGAIDAYQVVFLDRERKR